MNMVPNMFKDKKLSITFDGNKTILNVVSKDRDGKRQVDRFETRCHPDDEFDIRVAFDNLMNKYQDYIIRKADD